MDANLNLYLLPQPKHVRLTGGRTWLHADIDAQFDGGDARVQAEWERTRLRLPAARSGTPAVAKVVLNETPAVGAKDAYHLEVGARQVVVKGGSAAGCFYGLQTLAQLIDEDGQLPCCHIEDHPTFATRGLLHDVTRGKVPKLSTLKLIADRLARLKCNQLQLYIEHAFAFSFDPEICGPEDGLTPDEVRELDAYCRERFIDLVPAVATLGHMGRILSMPRYRHLAEIELTKPWEQMTWLQRLKGATLDVLNPESRRLVENIWSDIFAAFSSPVVNICGDEPWDLGKGKNARLTPGEAVEAYVGHLRWTAELAGRHGRACQIWSDVLRNHTDLLSSLPSDMTILHWGYDDRTDYEGTAAFTRAGYPTCVCPGTSGWKRILNAMNLAERNISTFARAGAADNQYHESKIGRDGRERGGVAHNQYRERKRAGSVVGLINTDWGDFGHFNQLACSWHGIALGAAFAWNADHVSGAEFDRLFARHVLRCPPQLITHLRAASAIAEKCETWRALITSREEFTAGHSAAGSVPSDEALEQAAAAAARAKALLEKCCASDVQDEELSRDFRELIAACQFIGLLADRWRQFHSADKELDFVTQIRASATFYCDCWLARNKEPGLSKIIESLVSAPGVSRPNGPT